MGSSRRKVNRGKRIVDNGNRAAVAPAPPSTPRRHRRKWLFIVFAVVCACAVGTILFEWISHRRRQPVLASLKMDGLDPMVAAAIDEAQAVVRNAPNSAAAWGKLGQILYVHGLDGSAADSFARASELAATDPRWPYLRGRALKRENGDAALPFLRRAAELCHGDPAAPALMLAELLIERGELTEVESQVNLVLQRNPTDARALLDRARLEIARGQWQSAQRDLTESIKHVPNVKVSHVLLASASARLGDAATSAREAQLARSLPENPRWPDPFIDEISLLGMGRSVLLERAESLLQAGHAKEAIAPLTAAAAQYPNDADVWMKFGDAYRQDGQMSEAEKAYRHAIAARPESSQAHLRLGTLLLAQKRRTDAMPPLQDAVRLSPNLPDTHYWLGECLLMRDHLPDAIAAFRESVRIEPSFRPGYIALGIALSKAGQPLDAAAQFRRALELDAADPATVELLKQAEAAARIPNSKP